MYIYILHLLTKQMEFQSQIICFPKAEIPYTWYAAGECECELEMADLRPICYGTSKPLISSMAFTFAFAPMTYSFVPLTFAFTFTFALTFALEFAFIFASMEVPQYIYMLFEKKLSHSHSHSQES